MLSPIIAAAAKTQTSDHQLSDAAQQAASILQQLISTQADAVSKVNSLTDLIAQLATAVDAQKATLLASQDRFNSAVQAASSDCSLTKVIAIGGAIVGVASAAFTAGTSLAATYAAIGSSGFNLLNTVTITGKDGKTTTTKQLNPTYQDMITAGSKVSDVVSAYNKLAGALGSDPDSARIVMAQVDADSLSSDFVKQVQAAPVDQSLKDDFIAQARRYYDLVQIRNKKILERDAWILKIHKLDTQISDQQNKINAIQDKRAGNANPELVNFAGMLTRMLEALRDDLRLLVWYETRALALWNLTPPSQDNSSTSFPQIIGSTVADLKTTHNQLAAQFLTLQAMSTAGLQPLDPPIQVSMPVTVHDARLFGTGKLFVFSVSPQSFPSFMTDVLVTYVIVQVEGLPKFSGALTHSGLQRFKTFDGKSIIEYSSPPWTTGIQIADGSKAIPLGASNGKYLGLSPFTTWVLRAADEVDSVALGGVTGISLTFQGLYRVNN